jgi:hypothetical protein
MKLNEIKRMLTRKTNLFVFKIGYQSLTLYWFFAKKACLIQ